MSGRIAAYQEGYTDGFDDAREKYKRPQSKWVFIKADETRVDGYECFNCKKTFHTKVPYFLEFNYCPNCGAKMQKPNCVTCDHFGKCEGCEKGEEE